MLLRYFYDEALAHASYLVGCQKTGEAVLIDPDRNIGQYLETARREGMRIVGAAETHIHADYVSGSRELAEKVNATLFVSDEGPNDWKYTYLKGYQYQLLKDGDEFFVGNIKFKVLHTPGHTPESISFLLTDVGGGADQPMGVFTGDFIFVGSVGRPDLLEEAAGQMGTAEPGARDLFHSIQKFKTLPDHLQVWPAHGAGSACGKGLGAIPSSTVGYEKMFNEGLQFESEDEFVKYILRDQPEAPPYFATMKHVNKHGPQVIGNQDLPAKIDVAQLAEIVDQFQVIDTGASSNFAKCHVPGTINVPVKQLASQGGWLVEYEKPVYLIANFRSLEESMRILREIGVDNVAGYFDFEDITASELATGSYDFMAPTQLAEKIERGDVTLIDVRQQTEWDEGRIPQASHWFLGTLPDRVASLDKSKPIVCQCRSGARSAIACSILKAAGIEEVVNLAGGIQQWQQDGFPVSTEKPQAVAAVSSE